MLDNELPALLTTKEAAQALFCKPGEHPGRKHFLRIYDMIEHGELTPRYKSSKRVQYLIPRKEILELIG